MKKRIFKRMMSLVLVVVMAVSTMAVSAVSASAATDKVKYEFSICTDGGDATSIDIMEFTVIGTKNETSTHSMCGIASKEGVVYASFEDKIDVGDIIGIRIKNVGIDGWYPKYINIKSPSDEEIVYGYRWIDDNNEVTLSKYDNVYSLDIATSGGDGTSSNNISVKLNGDNGSTGWHNVGKIAKNRTGSAAFYDIKNIGTVKSITVKNDGSDGWYPETISISKLCSQPNTKKINCGKWVDDKKEVTFSVTNRVAKLTVKTADHEYAGTDIDVYVNLYDENGNATGKVNLSELHPKNNAFERNDTASFVVAVPDNFGTVSKIDVQLYSPLNATMNYTTRWALEYIDVTLDTVMTRFGAYLDINNGKTHAIYPTDYYYTVTVKTANVSLAGTDNEVYLHAYDENNNEIGKFKLDNNYNNFEKNATDVFYITTSRKIADIKIELGVNSGTDWNLNYIQLDLMNGDAVKEKVVYNYNNRTIKANHKLYSPSSKSK